MRFLATILLALAITPGFAQEPQLSPNAPEDEPLSLSACQMTAYLTAIAPYVEQAKVTYPKAKRQFQDGLLDGQHFFVTTALYDATGRREQVFIAVREIDQGIIRGKIWSEIVLVDGYTMGDSYELPESAILDWLITQPDGSEEGNVVGIFLDTYEPSCT